MPIVTREYCSGQTWRQTNKGQNMTDYNGAPFDDADLDRLIGESVVTAGLYGE